MSINIINNYTEKETDITVLPAGIYWCEAKGEGAKVNITCLFHEKGVYVGIQRDINNPGDTTGNDKTYYSRDGITWEIANGYGSKIRMDTIVYNGIFHGIHNSIDEYKNFTYYSRDGITWEKCDFNFDPAPIQNLSYNGKAFVGLATFGKICYSLDGITWNYSDDIYQDGFFTVAESCNNRFFVSEDNKTITSLNGVDWIKCNIQGGDRLLKKFVYINNRYLSMGNPNVDPSGSYYSDNGIDWMLCSGAGSTYPIRYVNHFGNNIFGVDPYGAKFYYSPDGITWTITTIDGRTDLYLGDILYGNNTYIGYTSNPHYKCVYSKDCINWYPVIIENDGSNNIWSLVFYNGLFLGSHQDGPTYYSYNGINWYTCKGVGATSHIREITWFDNLYIGNNPSGSGPSDCKTFYSYDGINWFKCKTPEVVHIEYYFKADNGMIIANNGWGTKHTYYSKPIKRDKLVQQQLESQYPIGSTITLQSKNDPFSYLGFGEWETTDESAPYTYTRTA